MTVTVPMTTSFLISDISTLFSVKSRCIKLHPCISFSARQISIMIFSTKSKKNNRNLIRNIYLIVYIFVFYRFLTFYFSCIHLQNSKKINNRGPHPRHRVAPTPPPLRPMKNLCVQSEFMSLLTFYFSYIHIQNCKK